MLDNRVVSASRWPSPACSDDLATLQVSALVDLSGTAANVTVVPLLAGLNSPNGVVYHEGSLYVAEIRRITRYDNVDAYALTGQVRLALCGSRSKNLPPERIVS